MTTKQIFLTPQSLECYESIKSRGDFDEAMYSVARALGLVDEIGFVLQQADLAPKNRDELPQMISQIVAGLSLTKHMLADIQRATAKLDEAQTFLKRAMADPNGAATGAVRDGHQWVKEATNEILTLCRAIDVIGDDDDSA